MIYSSLTAATVTRFHDSIYSRRYLLAIAHGVFYCDKMRVHCVIGGHINVALSLQGGFVETINFDMRPQSLTKAARILNFLIYVAVWTLIFLRNINFKVDNTKAVPKKGPLIIVCAPHTSLADAVFMVASIRRSYAGIGMIELKNGDDWPAIVGKAFDMLGHIPVDRGNRESGNAAYAASLHALHHGQALVVWPQGRQVHPGDDVAWYPGFARLAKETGAHICIFKIEGADDFWPTNPDDGGPQKINWDAKVRATFSRPFDPAKYATVEELVDVMKRIHGIMCVPK